MPRGGQALPRAMLRPLASAHAFGGPPWQWRRISTLFWTRSGSKSLAEILKAPVSALQGISDGDADLLKQAFNIKTVGDLGKNKYFRAAQLLTQLTEAGAK